MQKRFDIYKDLEIFPNNDSLYITKIEEKEGFIKILLIVSFTKIFFIPSIFSISPLKQGGFMKYCCINILKIKTF